LSNGKPKIEDTQKEAIIRFENVSKVYKGNFPALEDINLEINNGEFVSIVGKSGAGKSTLLKIIYAEESPTAGIIFFEGRPLSELAKSKLFLHRRKIGTVFQDFKLLPNKTAFENVAYALEASGADDSEIMEGVPQVLDIVGLGNKMEKFPYQLSAGEQQRVAFARALIQKPMIIVADEPTGNLDPISSWDIIKLMLKINEMGTTIVLSSHDKYVVDKINKRVVILEDGKIIGDCPMGKYKLV
jgi:cell division transport system ATP-binding protein